MEFSSDPQIATTSALIIDRRAAAVVFGDGRRENIKVKMEDECDADDPRERREYLQKEKIVR